MRAILCAVALVVGVSTVRADSEKVEIKDLPKALVESLKKRFPKGELTAATKATAEMKTTFEVSVKSDGLNHDVNLNDDGTITGIEKEVAIKDLPKAVAAYIAEKYPKNKVKKAEEVITVKAGKETTEYFEVFVEVDGKDVEVEVLADGKPKPMDKK